ncbi:hypothetical protein SXCC_02793 [Gluconacetobacter sp. SXCC-1]|nr:hypothetical protein SXCC_02793 [Gluconacetobacter sp. SXCC-1]
MMKKDKIHEILIYCRETIYFDKDFIKYDHSDNARLRNHHADEQGATWTKQN